MRWFRRSASEPTGGLEPPTTRLQVGCAASCATPAGGAEFTRDRPRDNACELRHDHTDGSRMSSGESSSTIFIVSTEAVTTRTTNSTTYGGFSTCRTESVGSFTMPLALSTAHLVGVHHPLDRQRHPRLALSHALYPAGVGEATVRELRNHCGEILRPRRGRRASDGNQGRPAGRPARAAGAGTAVGGRAGRPVPPAAAPRSGAAARRPRRRARPAAVSAYPRGVLDTSVVVTLEEYDPDDLPDLPLITAITLAELSAGPLPAPRRDSAR